MLRLFLCLPGGMRVGGLARSPVMAVLVSVPGNDGPFACVGWPGGPIRTKSARSSGRGPHGPVRAGLRGRSLAGLAQRGAPVCWRWLGEWKGGRLTSVAEQAGSLAVRDAAAAVSESQRTVHWHQSDLHVQQRVLFIAGRTPRWNARTVSLSFFLSFFHRRSECSRCTRCSQVQRGVHVAELPSWLSWALQGWGATQPAPPQSPGCPRTPYAEWLPPGVGHTRARWLIALQARRAGRLAFALCAGAPCHAAHAPPLCSPHLDSCLCALQRACLALC
jgi:hypothetical protein